MGRGGGSRAAGAIAHRSVAARGRLARPRRGPRTAATRRRRRGGLRRPWPCSVDGRERAAEEPARVRSLVEVDAACQSSLSSLSDPFARRLAVAEGSLGDFERCQLFAAIARA